MLNFFLIFYILRHQTNNLVANNIRKNWNYKLLKLSNVFFYIRNHNNKQYFNSEATPDRNYKFKLITNYHIIF